MMPIVIMGAGAAALEILTYMLDQPEGGDAHADHVVALIDAQGGRPGDIAALLGRTVPIHTTADTISDSLGHRLIIGVGDPSARRKLAHELLPRFAGLISVVHPFAYVARTATLNDGVIVAPFAFVGPMAVVGRNAMLNVRATVGHHAEVGDHAVISPHADMNGFARCGEASFLGAGAIMLPSARIGAFSKIAAGSVWKQEAGDGYLIAGNPVRARQFFAVPSDLTPRTEKAACS